MPLPLRRLGFASLALATGLAAAPQALAHDVVVGGSVTEGEVLQELPEELTLEFSAIPREDFNTFALRNKESGEVLFSSEPEISGRNLTVEVPDGVEAEPGDYVIGFQITSSDGHATRGGVNFSIAGEKAANAAGTESSQSPQQPQSPDVSQAQGLSGGLKWILAIGGVLGILAVLALLFAKGRRLKQEGL